MGTQFLYPRLPHLTNAVINFSNTGDNTIIAAIASTRILVHRLWLVGSTASNITFKDGAGTSLSGAVPMAANGGITFDLTGEPWFTTALGNAFIINQSGTAQISGTVYYLTST
jgi:hypothetical protein